jgi:hypothetical protein
MQKKKKKAHHAMLLPSNDVYLRFGDTAVKKGCRMLMIDINKIY